MKIKMIDDLKIRKLIFFFLLFASYFFFSFIGCALIGKHKQTREAREELESYLEEFRARSKGMAEELYQEYLSEWINTEYDRFLILCNIQNGNSFEVAENSTSKLEAMCLQLRNPMNTMIFIFGYQIENQGRPKPSMNIARKMASYLDENELLSNVLSQLISEGKIRRINVPDSTTQEEYNGVVDIWLPKLR